MAASSLGPLFWPQLLSLLDERRVIPIVGADAVIVDGDVGPRPLTEYLARWVTALLELEETPGATLNEVACRYLERAGSQQISDVYWAIKQAMAERPIEAPEPLRKLARIRAFTLYISTTFDGLLRRAIDLERFGGSALTQSFAYSPEKVEDLPAPVTDLGGPAVYHLLGRLSAVPDYAVTEEDTLEFVHSLQSENHRPNLLLDEMRARSLLIIGSGYPDWLARFFLRVTKRERLLLARSKTDVVADSRAGTDIPLGSFLRAFSAQTKLYPNGALAFIDELSERWSEHAGAAEEEGEPQDPGETSESPEHAIFISYASEDRTEATALAEALRRAGLPVWLDHAGGLQGGDAYEGKIRRQIETASMFVPLLTPNVLTRQKRFFRLEWSLAGEIARRASEVLPFIVPVRVGEVPPDSMDLPEYLRRAHWLEGGGTYGEVAKRLRAIYREYQLTLTGVG
jgi:hypothetical protein